MGIVVGVPLGLAVAITAALFLNERRKLLQSRRALVLLYERKPAQTVCHTADPVQAAGSAKLDYSQSYRSRLPYGQSDQPPYAGHLSGDDFQEARASPESGVGGGVGEKGGEKATLQELP